MIENNHEYIALKMAEFIYKEISNDSVKHLEQQDDPKAYFFALYQECLDVLNKKRPNQI